MTNYCPILGTSQHAPKTCVGCRHWEPFSSVCTNADSPHCADFVDSGCDKKEKENATD